MRAQGNQFNVIIGMILLIVGVVIIFVLYQYFAKGSSFAATNIFESALDRVR
jgi:hypothetical protein